MVEIRWTPQSIEDIENIAADSSKYADIQVERFFEIENVLCSYPRHGRIVPELNEDNIREIVMGNYRIMYQIVNDKLISILTVHHSRRLLSNNPALDK